MDMGSSGYGTNGRSKRAVKGLLDRGWTVDEIAGFFELSSRIVIEVSKDYVDLLGYTCVKIETLVLVIDALERDGTESKAFLQRFDTRELADFFGSMVLLHGNPEDSAQALSERFSALVTA